jgi:hypothetical protein
MEQVVSKSQEPYPSAVQQGHAGWVASHRLAGRARVQENRVPLTDKGSHVGVPGDDQVSATGKPFLSNL